NSKDRIAAGPKRERAKRGPGQTGGGKETNSPATERSEIGGGLVRSRAGWCRTPIARKRCGGSRPVEEAGRAPSPSPAAGRPRDADGGDQRSARPFARAKSGGHARPARRRGRLSRGPGKTVRRGSDGGRDRQGHRESARRIRSPRSGAQRAKPRAAGSAQGGERPSPDRR